MPEMTQSPHRPTAHSTGVRKGGRPRVWTVERVRAELLEIAGEPEFLPSLRDLERAGRPDLRSAVRRLGTAEFWSATTGLRLRASQALGEYTPEDARCDLIDIIDRFGAVPGAGGMRALGYGRLGSYVATRGGSQAVVRDLSHERGRTMSALDSSFQAPYETYHFDTVRAVPESETFARFVSF